MLSTQLRIALAFAALLPAAADSQPRNDAPATYLSFNGSNQYVEVPSSREFSVSRDGLTVSAWMMPDTLTFPRSEGSGYVFWMGKGDRGRQEWAFRMYNRTNKENPPRPNRISFYVFNPEGGLGVGSYFQDPVIVRQWIQVTAVVDGHRVSIYRNGAFQRCDEFQGGATDGVCQAHPEVIHPTMSDAPMRFGTRDLRSFFKGGLSDIRIWDRALSASEVRAVYEKRGSVRNGLVAEFPLNEGEGTTAHDTVRHHDGRIVGATWAKR